ncbi:MAG: isoprenyl transferase [Roseiflexaceae bacterium]
MSEQAEQLRVPRHIAIIMDGNGRWAKQRGLPRVAGHRAGTENLHRIIRECAEQGVRYLTLYAFSSENWNRPSAEVNGLMMLLSEYINRETENLHREGAQIRHLGRMQGINEQLQRKIHDAVALTRNNTRITVAVAFNYGGRADVVDAVREIMQKGYSVDQITEELISEHLSTSGMPDPDLIIRTAGEWRLSNFLIWQAAYSEYWATPIYWPEFGPEHLRQAILDYGRRERRFGGLTNET